MAADISLLLSFWTSLPQLTVSCYFLHHMTSIRLNNTALSRYFSQPTYSRKHNKVFPLIRIQEWVSVLVTFHSGKEEGPDERARWRNVNFYQTNFSIFKCSKRQIHTQSDNRMKTKNYNV